MFNPNQQGQPQQPPQPQEAEEYAEAGEMEGRDGGDEAPEIDPEELQMLIFSRVEQLSTEEAQAFAQLVTPQSAGVLFKLFPELGPLLQEIIMAKQQQGQGGMPQQGGQPMPAGGQPQMAQRPPMQPPQQQSVHPLLSDEVSKGLVG